MFWKRKSSPPAEPELTSADIGRWRIERKHDYFLVFVIQRMPTAEYSPLNPIRWTHVGSRETLADARAHAINAGAEAVRAWLRTSLPSVLVEEGQTTL